MKKYCKLLERKEVFNAGYVELYDFSAANSCQEAREEACSLVASATRGKDCSNNPVKLYERLSKEAAGGKPGRVFEFLPWYDTFDTFDSEECRYQNFMRFSHINEDGKLRTNLRNALKYGFNCEDPDGFDHYFINKGFIAVKIKAPEFVWQQFATHEMMGRNISRVSESRRVTEIGDYWLPEGVDSEYMSVLLKQMPFFYAQVALINRGMKKEIHQRFPQGWEYRTFWLCGWLQDPDSWRNLLQERGALPELWEKTWVQEQTKEVATIIRNQVEKSMPEMFKKYCGE